MDNYITIYAEDFPCDVWKDYCRACNVPLSATSIRITFTDDQVSYEETDNER